MKIITKDLYEASYLLSQGMKLQDVLGEKRKVLFLFEGDENLNLLKQNFDRKTAQVNLYQLRSHLNYLRDIIFSKAKERETVKPC